MHSTIHLRTRAFIAFAYLLCSMISACQPFRAPEIKLPYMLPVHVLRWEQNQPVIRIETPCYNQNDAGFTFKGGQLDLYIDTFYLGHAVVDTSFPVGARSAFTVPAQLKIDIASMIARGLRLDSVVAVRVDGEMSGATLGIRKTIPIHLHENHTIQLIMTPF